MDWLIQPNAFDIDALIKELDDDLPPPATTAYAPYTPYNIGSETIDNYNALIPQPQRFNFNDTLNTITDGNNVTQVSAETFVMAQNLETIKWERHEDWIEIMTIMYCNNNNHMVSTATSPTVPALTPDISIAYTPSPATPTPDTTVKRKGPELLNHKSKTSKTTTTTNQGICPDLELSILNEPLLDSGDTHAKNIVKYLSKIKLFEGMCFETYGQARFHLWAYQAFVAQKAMKLFGKERVKIVSACIDSNCCAQAVIEPVENGLLYWRVNQFQSHILECKSKPDNDPANNNSRLIKSFTKNLFYLLSCNWSNSYKEQVGYKVVKSGAPRYKKPSVKLALEEFDMANENRILASMCAYFRARGDLSGNFITRKK